MHAYTTPPLFHTHMHAYTTPPLFALWQSQPQDWIKEEGGANGLITTYQTGLMATTTCVHTNIYTCTHAYTQTHIYTHAKTEIYKHRQTHTHIHTHANTHIQKQSNTHIHIYKLLQRHVPRYIPIYLLKAWLQGQRINKHHQRKSDTGHF